jgi:Zn-finger nucleic acid-binding protein
MFCPVDKIGMHRVKIISHYGQPIELDQCEICGGIWFDESELFRAKQGEAEKIELLDVSSLKNPSMIENSTLTCPRDQAVLYQFNDKYFPKDIILARCPKCKGIWLNRGLFTKYQRFRQELKGKRGTIAEDKRLEERISPLIAAHHSEHPNDTLNRLGEFLSSNPLADEKAAGVALDALGIMMMILRFLIPF